jgi:hypothetical protein
MHGHRLSEDRESCGVVVVRRAIPDVESGAQVICGIPRSDNLSLAWKCRQYWKKEMLFRRPGEMNMQSLL